MTVQELIDQLMKVEDKSMEVWTTWPNPGENGFGMDEEGSINYIEEREEYRSEWAKKHYPSKGNPLKVFIR